MRQNSSSVEEMLVGRWRCWNTRPVREATTTHPAKGEREDACAGLIASASEIDGVSRPRQKASSEQGTLVTIFTDVSYYLLSQLT